MRPHPVRPEVLVNPTPFGLSLSKPFVHASKASTNFGGKGPSTGSGRTERGEPPVPTVHPVEGSEPCAVGVFARAPIPGQTKTRLIPALGPEGAAALAAQMLRHALRVAVQAGLGPVTLWAAGDTAHPLLLQLAQEAGVPVRAQAGGDLGARMHHALGAMQSPACPRALIIGSDVPALETQHLRRAALALQQHPVAVLPADDGGYVLIGCQGAPLAPFTDVQWGSERVLRQTRDRCGDAALRLWEGEVLWDVDRPEDLARLAGLDGFPGDAR